MTTDSIGTAELGRRLAADALRDRGFQVTEHRSANLVLLEARHPADGRRFRVRVKTRTAGTWQGSIRDGDPDPTPTRPATFWLFVDLGTLDFQRWEGEKPITVWWRLREAVPESLHPALGIPAAQFTSEPL